MGKRSLKGRGRKRVSKRDLMQMEKIEALLESVNTESHVKPVITRPVTPIVTPTVNKVKRLQIKSKSISLDDLWLTDHGYERAIERLHLQRTERNEVLSYLKSKLYQAEHIGRITSSKGNESEMFAIGSISIQLSPDFKRIITVMKYNKIPHNPALGKMKELVHKEFRKLDRLEKSRTRKLRLYEFEIQAQIAELQLKGYKSRYDSVKVACKNKIVELEDSLKEDRDALGVIKMNKRQLAYGLCSIL